MRPEWFRSDSLIQLLRKRTIATMPDLKAALGTRVDMTVFRKLRTLGYLTWGQRPEATDVTSCSMVT